MDVYPTYEDALRDYLFKLKELTQPPQERAADGDQIAIELPAQVFLQRVEEIAGISSVLLQLADGYLHSADPTSREGIRFHFIDQSTVELLLGIELLRVSQQAQAAASTAAIRATHSAALREAISAAEKSSACPIKLGVQAAGSYRSSNSASLNEAVSGLKLAAESTAHGITRRIQELGNDIMHDLASGVPWSEVVQGTSLSFEEVCGIANSIQAGVAGPILLQVYKKVLALYAVNAASEARVRICGWLHQISGAEKMDGFDALVESLYKIDEVRKSISGIECATLPFESLNKASDRIKALWDKFMLLIGRMRKLEDAIRLGKLIEIPQFRTVTIALHVALLSALVNTGWDYIHNGLMRILRQTQDSGHNMNNSCHPTTTNH